ncbi:MAG: PAS domain-containing protein, partial [Gammaproteobacteria bacterium]
MIEFPALNRLPVPLFRSTADGRLAYVNDAWTEEIGAPVGTSWFQTFPEIDEAIAAELWRECVSARSPVSLPSNLMHKEGQPRWYRVLLQPVLVDVVEHMMGSMTDVTDQTVALAESRAILETAVDGIIIIDEQGIIRTFNKAAGELFGYPAEAAVGKSI